MQAVREITEWASPNHTYLLDGNNLVAYIKQGQTQAYYFKQPIKGFDKRGRKFVAVDDTGFTQKWIKAEVIRVQGSKGNIYEVDPEAKTCTCPGFTFRGACKHMETVLDPTFVR